MVLGQPLVYVCGRYHNDTAVAVVQPVYYTAIIALVASGALPLPAAIAAVLGTNIGTTGTIWLAGLFVSDGMPKGDTLRIAMAHTGVELVYGSYIVTVCISHRTMAR